MVEKNIIPAHSYGKTLFHPLAATQSPPGELIQTVMFPSPAISSSLKSWGVTSSSNQLSSAMVPFRYSVRSAGAVSVWA